MERREPDEDVELAAAEAYFGNPQFPCCPHCGEMLHIHTTLDGVAIEFDPGGYYQRIHLDGPLAHDVIILGDVEGDCFYCSQHVVVRDCEWRYIEDLSQTSRLRAEDRRPMQEARGIHKG